MADRRVALGTLIRSAKKKIGGYGAVEKSRNPYMAEANIRVCRTEMCSVNNLKHGRLTFSTVPLSLVLVISSK